MLHYLKTISKTMRRKYLSGLIALSYKGFIRSIPCKINFKTLSLILTLNLNDLGMSHVKFESSWAIGLD